MYQVDISTRLLGSFELQVSPGIVRKQYPRAGCLFCFLFQGAALKVKPIGSHKFIQNYSLGNNWF